MSTIIYAPSFTSEQAEAIGGLASEYAETCSRAGSTAWLARDVTMFFEAALRVCLDPETPRDCLAWKELGPLVATGLDLADERTQEDILGQLVFHAAMIWRRYGGDA